MPTPICTRQRGTKRGSAQFGQLANSGGGRLPRAVGAGDRAIEINLPSGQHAIRNAGACPNLKSATPVSLKPCSSEPYWNSTFSISADCPLALTFPLTRQGCVKVCAGCAAPRAAIPTGRDRANIPSKRGSPAANVSAPSASILSARSTGSTLTCSLSDALLAQAADSDAIRIKLAGDRDGALALHRPDKRTCLTVEPHPIRA